ncbi:Ephrin type-B receptor 1-B [Dissostichus eleginoides]|nr:Ephrin type-B receptor 1-B [Dissostichus eleginoides]
MCLLPQPLSVTEAPVSDLEDLQRIGVALAGHQKKILTSVQSMRHNIDDQSPTESV